MVKCEISVVYTVHKASKIELHQPTTASTWWRGPQPVWVGSKWLLVFPRVPATPCTPPTRTIFSPCCPLNDRRRASSLNRSPVFSCLSSARPLILLLVLMSGNVHPSSGSISPCSVCAGNVTWRGRSVQCCTCYNWVHLKCSLLSFSRFRALGNSYSWSCPPCCVPASSGDFTATNTVNSSLDCSSLYIFTAQSGPLC